MSRSRKKTIAGGITTAASDKIGKRQANRALRRRVNMQLSKIDEDNAEDIVFYVLREASNIYNFPKDGKVYYHNLNKEQTEYERRK